MEVHLIDSMGSDVRVAEAARVSFQKDIPNKILRDQDIKLINYLARHNHFTPFTHVQITMKERVPIFVARQRFKHTVGFSYNEVSRRYVDDAPEFYVPEIWRGRPTDGMKQGSDSRVITTFPDHGMFASAYDSISEAYENFLASAHALYSDMVHAEIAPEQVRMILPQSMYTEYYVTGSLSAWARAYKLRIDPHAQWEIQQLARMWDTVIKAAGLPIEHSWKALTEGIKDGD